MIDLNKTKIGKFSLYFILAASAVGLFKGFFYLYSLYRKTDKLADEQIIEIEEIKLLILENKGDISTDLVIRILVQINKRSAELMKNSNPSINSKRREAITNNKEYIKQCNEYFNQKNYYYGKATKDIIKLFNFRVKDLKKLIEQIPYYDIERKIIDYSSKQVESLQVDKFDKHKAKEAFIYFGNTFLDEISLLYNHMKSNIPKEDNENKIYKLLLAKLKVEDKLYIRYQILESQLRYMINEFSLMDLTEVNELNNKILKYEEEFYVN